MHFSCRVIKVGIHTNRKISIIQPCSPELLVYLSVMSHTCVKDGRMEERELQFWTCEYPVHTEENHIKLRRK